MQSGPNAGYSTFASRASILNRSVCNEYITTENFRKISTINYFPLTAEYINQSGFSLCFKVDKGSVNQALC